jgi:hypothetical protein
MTNAQFREDSGPCRDLGRIRRCAIWLSYFCIGWRRPFLLRTASRPLEAFAMYQLGYEIRDLPLTTKGTSCFILSTGQGSAKALGVFLTGRAIPDSDARTARDDAF